MRVGQFVLLIMLWNAACTVLLLGKVLGFVAWPWALATAPIWVPWLAALMVGSAWVLAGRETSRA